MAGEWDSFRDASPVDVALVREGADGKLAALARSVFQQESGSGKNTATSSAGARGGMQIIPATFKSVADAGWNIDNPAHNAQAGVRYLKKMLEAGDGDPRLAAVGYYGGPGAIDKAKRGVAVYDPREPKAPSTLQYGDQVVSRMAKADSWDMFKDAPQVKSQSTAPAIQSPTDTMNTGETFLAGIGKGLTDVVRGGKQRLDEGAAALEAIVPGGAALSRLFGGKTAAQIKDEGQNAVTESKRLDAPLLDSTAGTLGNVTGNLAAGLLTAPMGAVGGGVALGFMAPTTGGTQEVLQNMGAGAAGGFIGDRAARGLARVVSPKAANNEAVRKLINEGVTPTPGQILGGRLARVEARATSLPVIGDAIVGANKRATAELNAAAFNRALAPIGEKLPNGVAGRDAVEYASAQLGNAYDNLLPKLSVQMDRKFLAETSKLQQMVQQGAIDPKYADLFERFLRNRVLGKFQGQNAVTGQTLKDIESFLGSESRRFGQSMDPDARLMGNALQELQANVRRLVQRTNPAHAKELQAINTGWDNFKRVQRAASSLGAEDGQFTAAQLQNSVKALDRSKDKARFSEGRALMQDLSDAAKGVMGSKYPDSGTAGRMRDAGVIGSWLINPAIPMSIYGGSALYSAPAQKLIAGLLTSRPQGAGLLADAIRPQAPKAGLLGAAAALEATR
ncbi:MAG: hypothetical protein RL758_277 [Pseudomonadota bacterium]|jgi:hypothetical protein